MIKSFVYGKAGQQPIGGAVIAQDDYNFVIALRGDLPSEGEVASAFDRDLTSMIGDKKGLQVLVSLADARFVGSSVYGIIAATMNQGDVRVATPYEKHIKFLPVVGLNQDYKTLDEMLMKHNVHKMTREGIKRKLAELPKGFSFEGDLHFAEILAIALGSGEPQKLRAEIQRMDSEGYSLDGDQLNVPSQMKYAALSHRFLEKALGEGRILGDGLSRDDLKYVVMELTQNSITHGYRGADRGVIAIRKRISEDGVAIGFIDYGAGIEKTREEDPKKSIGGHGLKSIRSLVEAVGGTMEELSSAPRVVSGSPLEEFCSKMKFTPVHRKARDFQGEEKIIADGTTITIVLPSKPAAVETTEAPADEDDFLLPPRED